MAASERSFHTMNTSFAGGTLRSSTVDKYASWDRRILGFIKKTEKLLFSAMHAMIQQNAFRIKYSSIGVLVDFLQVYAFTLSADFGFGTEYEIVSSFIQAPLQLVDWTSFEVFFWLVALIISSSFVVAYYVGYTFLQSDFTVVWPIKYLRTMVNLILSVLFIPFLTVLVVPLKEDPATGYLKHFVADKIVAWGPVASSYAAISIVLIIIFVPFCLLMGLLSFEFAPNTKDPMARHSSWLDFVYLILKTMLVFVTNFTSSDTASVVARATIIFVATLFVLSYLLWYVPYYGRYINIIRSVLFGALLGAALSTAVKAYTGVSFVTKHVSTLAVFGIHLAATVIFGAIGGFVMYSRLASRTRGNPFKYVTRRAQQTSASSPGVTRRRPQDVVMSPVATSTRTPGGNRRTSDTSSFLGRHATAPATATPKSTGFFKTMYETIKTFGLGSELLLRVLFLRLRAPTEDTIHLADTVYLRMIDGFRGKAILHIHYANFLLSYKHDWLAASAQVRKAEVIGCGFFHRWLCFGLHKRIDMDKRSARLGSSTSVDLMKYVEFQHVLSRARRAHLESLRYLRHFWETLVEEVGDRQMTKMAKSQIEAGEAQSRALFAYCKLISSFPNSPILWRSYASFLADVASEEEEAQMALQTADDLEEKQSQHTHAATHYQEVGAAGPDSLRTAPLSPRGSSTLAGIPEEPEERAGEEDETQSQKERRRSAIPDHTSQVGGSSIGHGTSHTFGTGTSGTSTTVVSRRLVAQLVAGASSSRLNKRFMQAFAVIFVLVVGNFVASRALIDGQTEHITAAYEVVDVRMSTILTTVAASELAIDFHLNGTDLGMDQETRWKILPHGVSGHAKFIDHEIEHFINHTDELLSASSSTGWGIDVAWDQTKAHMHRFPGGKEYNDTVKNSMDTWRMAVLEIVDDVVNKKVDPEHIFDVPAFGTMIMNGLEEIGGANHVLGGAYLKAMEDTTVLLQSVIMGVAGIAFITVLLLVIFWIRPSIHESHLDEHLIHVLLLLVPMKHIEAILKRIQKNEMDLLQQLTDVGDEDEAEDHDVAAAQERQGDGADQGAEADQKRKKKKGHWLLRSSNVEGAIYREAHRQERRCKGMRKLAYLYTAALAVILIILSAQSATTFLSMADDIMAARSLEVAGDRIVNTAEAFAMSYWLPEELHHHMGTVMPGHDPHDEMRDNLNRMRKNHNALTYGSKDMGISGTHAYIEKYQKAIVAEIKGVLNEWVSAVNHLLLANESTLLLTNDAYYALQKNWDQPGDFQKAMTASVLNYYDTVVKSHVSLNVANIVWLIMEIVSIVLVYIVLLRRLLGILLDRDEGYIRTVKTLSIQAVAETPMLIEFLRDRSIFVDRIKDRASQDVGDGLDDTWALAFIRQAPEAYIVVGGSTSEILEVNAAAEELFGIKAKDMRQKKVEILAAPAYRAALDAAIKSLGRRDKGGARRSIMAARHNGTQFAATARVHELHSSDHSGVSRNKNRMYVVVIEPTDEQPSPASTSAIDGAEHSLWISAPVVLVGLNGIVMEGTNAAAQMLQMDELKGRRFSELFTMQTEAEQLLQECLAAPSHEMSRTLGSIRVSLTATAYAETSEARSVIAMLEDRSDYQSLHRSLLVHERTQTALLSSLPIGVIGTDVGRQIVMFSEPASAILGHTRSKVLGQDVSVLFRDPFDSWVGDATNGRWVRVVGRKGDGTVVAVSVSLASVCSDREGTTEDPGKQQLLVFIQPVEASDPVESDP